LKTASGTVIDSVDIKPAKGWKATSAATFDVSKFSNNEELLLELLTSPNGIVITRITLE
jgi:hypothetical protein